MKTLKFGMCREDATIGNKIFFGLFVTAMFGYLGGCTLLAFFAPDLLTWSTPKKTYEATAFAVVIFALAFLWENRKALLGVITASFLLILMPTPAHADDPRCEDGGGLYAVTEVTMVVVGGATGWVAGGGKIAFAVAGGLTSAGINYQIGGGLETRICNGVVQGSLDTNQANAVTAEALSRGYSALGKAFGEMTSEIMDNIQRAWLIPVKSFTYDSRYDDLGNERQSDGSYLYDDYYLNGIPMFFSSGGYLGAGYYNFSPYTCVSSYNGEPETQCW